MENLVIECGIAKAVDELFMEMLSKGGKPRLNVISGSMQPLIRIRDNVIIKQIRPKDLIISDIIVYQANQKYITHRIFSKRKSDGQLVFYTKGDMLISFDPPITEKQIIGKVIGIEKSNRILKLDSFCGKIINYFIFFYLLLFWSVYKLARFFKKKIIGKQKNKLVSFCYRFFWKIFPLLPRSLLKMINFL